MDIIYIHYGSDHFDSSLFIPIRNGTWKPKPEDGTGLWASREEDSYPDMGMNYSWKFWCEDNRFQMERLESFFRFQLSPAANVLILRKPEDLIPLPKDAAKQEIPWQPKDKDGILSVLESESVTPSLEQLQKLYAPNWCYLDYEQMLRDGIDAVELTNSFLFNDSLATWDCDCMVVLNPDVVVEV